MMVSETIFPIRLENGRYSIARLPENERTCLVCKDSLLVDIPAGAGPVIAGGDLADGGLAGGDLADGGLAGVDRAPVESEAHFLFFCEPYKTERELWFAKMTIPHDFLLLNLESKLKLVLNEPSNAKLTARYITSAFNIRSYK
jgi:hypothetical protein